MPFWRPRRNKFNAKPVVADGERFASTAEFKRYCTLQLEQRAGQIRDLAVHPRFSLTVGAVHICDYVADFSYLRAGADAWFPVIEDSKSPATLTPECKIKLKLMKACHGIDVVLTGAIANKRRKAA